MWPDTKCSEFAPKEDPVPTDGIFLHKARLRRFKLGFVCQMTAVGIPMILAGEKFGDEHDLFDSQGKVTQEGGKQVDPANYSWFDEPDRRDCMNTSSAWCICALPIRRSR
jgi:hypothetical protein